MINNLSNIAYSSSCIPSNSWIYEFIKKNIAWKGSAAANIVSPVITTMSGFDESNSRPWNKILPVFRPIIDA